MSRNWPIAVSAGILAAQLFRALPPRSVLLVLSLLPLTGFLHQRLRLPALFCASLCWALWTVEGVLDNRPSGVSDISLDGYIASIPEVRDEYTRFLFLPVDGPSGGRPGRLLLNWYRDRPPLKVGERWTLQLRIKPPWGSVNFQGADKERWLFTERIDAIGSVRTGHRVAPPASAIYRVERLREQAAFAVTSRLADHPMTGVVLALATADRSRLDARQRQTLVTTGTAHLLAISGLHVGLAALGGLWLGRLLGWFLPSARRGKVLPLASLACAVGAAAFYAVLAALQVSTLRAVVMLAAFAAAGFTARSVHPARPLLLAFALVLLVDPLAPAAAGFWFSFGAVAALLAFFVPRERTTGGLTHWGWQLTRAQWAVTLVLTPLTAYWFQAYSLSGLAANLVAIPWVSFTVVPPVLLGLLAWPVLPDAAEWLWRAAAESAGWLFVLLDRMASWQTLFPDTSVLRPWQLALSMAGGLLLLLPAALRIQHLGLALLLPAFMPAKRHDRATELLIEVLDAGQGTAIILSDGKRSMLYDTGAGDGKTINVVASTVLPALKSGYHLRRPELVIVSHGDLDHAGGLPALRRHLPDAEFLVNEGRKRGDLCHQGLEWTWDAIRFRVLHPSTGLPYLKNDSSCVLSITGPNTSLLLTGDVSTTIEDRLAAERLERHDLVLVPHHGSKTSSGNAFIAATAPVMAVATASLGNRFGFPKEPVVQRYLSAGSRFWSTGSCGALRIRFHEDGSFTAQSARRERQRLWRWPVAEECP